MTEKTKRKIRDWGRLGSALLCVPIYIPHLFAYMCMPKAKTEVVKLTVGGGKWLIDSDLKKMKYQTGLPGLPKWMILLNLLHNNRYYRNLFYHRIGAVKSALISWIRPGDRYFIIGKTTKIGAGMWIAHPYATVLGANSIGDNFRCIHCTTLGSTEKGKPTIGNNVSLGANVTIVGPVRIGDNVTIGAGSVVVKDIPDNCMAAGVPAKVIKYKA